MLFRTLKYFFRIIPHKLLVLRMLLTLDKKAKFQSEAKADSYRPRSTGGMKGTDSSPTPSSGLQEGKNPDLKV